MNPRAAALAVLAIAASADLPAMPASQHGPIAPGKRKRSPERIPTDRRRAEITTMTRQGAASAGTGGTEARMSWTMDHVDAQGRNALRYLIESGARFVTAYVGVYDWNRAFWDAGPSPAGNLGPYAHVPVAVTWENGDTEELVVRAYPRDKRTRERLVRMLGWRECEGNYEKEER